MSINPIQEYNHTLGSAVIGGYVYRGPIEALQGKYFYGDFLSGLVRTLDFDREHPHRHHSTAQTAHGQYLRGTQLRVFDPNDPNYTHALAGDAFGIDKITGFGEDNNGNLYIIDFGGTAGDSSFTNETGEYPSAGRGEIFKLVPVLRGDANNSGAVDTADFTDRGEQLQQNSGVSWTAAISTTTAG